MLFNIIEFQMKYSNNPLNVRFVPRNSWIGQDLPKNGFCQFTDLYYGFRAALKVILSYRKRGLTTIKQIIPTYAPPSDGNNTVFYIQKCCRATGFDMNTPLPVDIETFTNLFSAMFFVEQGRAITIEERKVLTNVLINLLPK